MKLRWHAFALVDLAAYGAEVRRLGQRTQAFDTDWR